MNTYIQKMVLSTLVIGFAVVGITAHAQEFPSLSKLAQDYLYRMTGDTKPDTVRVVNTEQFTREAVNDSIQTINTTMEEVRVQKNVLITEVKEAVKRDVDSSIIEIRQTTDKPAFELQRAVDTERTQLFDNVTRTVESLSPVNTARVETLETQVRSSLNTIEANLEDESGMDVDFVNSKREIQNAFFEFSRVMEQKRQIIESRSGTLIFEDSDGDGVSDYDEIHIYNTDPYNAYTVPGPKNDGQKILEGIDPLSETFERKTYDDPREDIRSYVTSTYKLEKVQLIKEPGASDTILFEGVALPNSFVTLFIYSTPIVVTVKTAESGAWSYELKQELENGEHQVYVATVDNSGKLVARSNPVLFTKSAEAATIGIVGSLDSSTNAQNFLKDNFILITLALLIAVVIISMMFIGNHSTVRSAIADLHNEVNTR